MIEYYYAAMAGIQIVNSVVKANNTKKAAERQNETIRAKQAWLEQEKIHSKKSMNCPLCPDILRILRQGLVG